MTYMKFNINKENEKQLRRRYRKDGDMPKIVNKALENYFTTHPIKEGE